MTDGSHPLMTSSNPWRYGSLRAFQRIDVADRLLLTLHYHLGLADREIAELMHVPTGTVKSRLHHGLRRLRAAFDAEDRA
jgi:RNA polymerase sigma-70 factor, ECF subfamily